jgi:hypothetical protein
MYACVDTLNAIWKLWLLITFQAFGSIYYSRLEWVTSLFGKRKILLIHYTLEAGSVLFKPTKVADTQFRLTREKEILKITSFLLQLTLFYPMSLGYFICVCDTNIQIF